ncbi:hypothetical protein [Streptomyces sp. NPDC004629]|uniref:hypothetical protein n=1 Tax=Streptomyces sp. NPDC004629 TaxID=3364705 RepID=UPI003684FDC0
MAETTQTEATPDKPTAYGWCTWHKGAADGIRLISAIEQGSGPGVGLFACGPCRDVYGLVPLTDRP